MNFRGRALPLVVGMAGMLGGCSSMNHEAEAVFAYSIGPAGDCTYDTARELMTGTVRVKAAPDTRDPIEYRLAASRGVSGPMSRYGEVGKITPKPGGYSSVKVTFELPKAAYENGYDNCRVEDVSHD